MTNLRTWHLAAILDAEVHLRRDDQEWLGFLALGGRYPPKDGDWAAWVRRHANPVDVSALLAYRPAFPGDVVSEWRKRALAQYLRPPEFVTQFGISAWV